MIVSIIILSLALLSALCVAWMLWRRVEADRERHAKALTDVLAEKETAVRAEANLRVEMVRLEERLAAYEKALKEREKQAEIDNARFKAIAADVLAANSTQLNEQHQSQLEQILKPLRENIESFRKAVNDSYSAEARERFSLQKSIEELVKTNTSIGNEARELARALRGDSKVQGDWGEFILESILEKSGLRRGEEFFVQMTTDEQGHTLRDEQGRHLRPDVVVKYPDGKYVVIDSKVSLTAYVDLVNAEGDAERQSDALARHLRSVRSHLNELDAKNYQGIVAGDATDFVLMFIPNEGAYMAAMQREPTLWQEAYDKRVLIVSPTHLVSVLKIVSQLWTHDRQSKNAIEIATEAGSLIDKVSLLVESIDLIGKNLNTLSANFETARNRLYAGKGNLLGKVKKLRDMGAGGKKQLPKAADDAVDDGEDAE